MNKALTTGHQLNSIVIRQVAEQDSPALHAIELECFTSDRLSKRRIKHWIKAKNRILLVAEDNQGVLGYGLALLHQGTRHARLYSLAVSQRARGTGLGTKLLQQIEAAAAEQDRLYMRLEVAHENTSAITLYTNQGYQVFGTYSNYYENHQDALRMQKRIRHIPENLLNRPMPWYRQTTRFTCGPACLMTAMSSLDKSIKLSQDLELDIWREATTIFMTSGHGGCHPIGLALAAKARGFWAEVSINLDTPLFVDGVRSKHKKAIMTTVDAQFRKKAKTQDVRVRHRDVSQAMIERWLKRGAAVIMLISTYRMDGKKTPHWVTLTGMDDDCLYFHDSDPSKEGQQIEFDCQHIPIARADFEKMSSFGAGKLRTAIVLEKRTETA